MSWHAQPNRLDVTDDSTFRGQSAHFMNQLPKWASVPTSGDANTYTNLKGYTLNAGSTAGSSSAIIGADYHLSYKSTVFRATITYSRGFIGQTKDELRVGLGCDGNSLPVGAQANLTDWQYEINGSSKPMSVKADDNTTAVLEIEIIDGHETTFRHYHANQSETVTFNDGSAPNQKIILALSNGNNQQIRLMNFSCSVFAYDEVSQ